MPGHSPKRKETSARKKKEVQNTGSDYRLVIVLGGAILIAIAIIVAVMWTTQ